MSSAVLVEFLGSHYGIEKDTLDILQKERVGGEALLVLHTSLESPRVMGLKMGPAVDLQLAVKDIQQGGDGAFGPAATKCKRRFPIHSHLPSRIMDPHT